MHRRTTTCMDVHERACSSRERSSRPPRFICTLNVMLPSALPPPPPASLVVADAVAVGRAAGASSGRPWYS
jgi:hypothetical protein